MKTRLLKECRDLLFPFLGTLLLIAVPYALWRGEVENVGYFALGLGCVVMGGTCFGSEFHNRTLSLLLSQPLPRQVIWREKMWVLGFAMVVNLAVAWICLAMFCPEPEWWALVAIAVCAFCSVPAWTLRSGQVITGVTIAAGAPAFLLILGSLVVGAGARWISRPFFESPQFLTAGTSTLLVAYSAWAYRSGRKCFLGLQILDAKSPEIELPAKLEARLYPPLHRIAKHFTGPLAALIKKELRLQQTIYLGAALFCLIAVVAALAYRLHPELFVGILGADYVVYIIVVPFVTGAIALSEEKSWGIADWHLTLPPSLLRQWSAKLSVTLLGSLALGVLLPLGVFLATQGLFVPPGKGISRDVFEALPLVLLGQCCLTGLAVYAGSISRDTLRAILLSFGLILLLACCVWAGSALANSWFSRLVFSGPSIALPTAWWTFFGGALLLYLALFLRFAFANFRPSAFSFQKALLQIFVLASGMVLASLLLAISYVEFRFGIS